MGKSKKRTENFIFNAVIILFAFLITLSLIVTGAYLQEGYDLSVGVVSSKRFKATRRIENTLATEQNRAAAQATAAEMKPLLKKDTTADERILHNLDTFFHLVDENREEYAEEVERRNAASPRAEADTADSMTFSVEEPQAVVDALAPFIRADAGSINRAGIGKANAIIAEANTDTTGEVDPSSGNTQANEADQDTGAIPLPTLPIALTDAQIKYILTIDEQTYLSLKNDILAITDQVLETGIQDVDAKSLLYVKDEFAQLGIDAQVQSLGYEIVTSFLEPNFLVDEAATEKARQEIANDYATVYLVKDQTIVDEGQIISEEAYAMLEALGLVSQNYAQKAVPIIGAAVIVALIFAGVLWYMAYFHKTIAKNKKESLLVFTIYTLVMVLTWALIGAPYQYVPLMVFTMLIAILINAKLAIVMSVGMTVIGLLIFKGDLEFLIFFSLGQILISLLARRATERNKVFSAGILAFLLYFALSLSLSLFFDKSYSTNTLYMAAAAAANGLLTVIICVGSLPFWEAAFGVVTSLKLLDLINPNSAIMRRLAVEAPGTYHHSLIVANLAETAALDIGANPNIARVGGYHHDIGKLKYPQYFSENQVGDENPHNFLDPHSSVQVILNHVTYGTELANNHKLPKVVKDTIAQHHGSSLIKYFYYKVKNANPDIEVDPNDFRYKNDIPQSKETAIIMLADTVEAAVRSIIPTYKSFAEIDNLVKALIKDKLDDGQLDDSGLTIKDINMVSESFMRVFKGMYHERIPYPSDKSKEQKTEEAKDETEDEASKAPDEAVPDEAENEDEK